MSGLKNWFSKRDYDYRLSVFFLKNSTACMLDAAEYNTIDQLLLPSVKMLALATESSPLPLSLQFCTGYVDLMKRSYNCFQSPGWTEVDLDLLQNQTISFKPVVCLIVGLQQARCMKKFKQQTLNQLLNKIIQVGSIEYLNAGWFESFHNCSKYLQA